jgi:uncharacterized membrane protein YfcA
VARPYLILFATALFALSGPVNALARRRADPVAEAHGGGVPLHPGWIGIMLYQFGVSIYGGYFGAGIGIMMLAGLALVGFTAIHRAIALRNYYAILINGIAAVYFILFAPIAWGDAAVLTVGQVLGGLVGAASRARCRRRPSACSSSRSGWRWRSGFSSAHVDHAASLRR